MLFFATPHKHLLGVRLEEGKPVRLGQTNMPTGGRPVRLDRVDMPTGSPVRYEPVNSPLSRLDAIDDRLYVGQTDGLFHAFDIVSGTLLFTIQTSGHRFGPTRKVGDYLVVQAEGEIVVLKIW